MLTDYRAIYSPGYFGRGAVHIGAPLRGDGSVGAAGWPARVPGAPLQLPPGRPIGNARRLDVTPQLTRLNVSAWDSRDSVIVNGVTMVLELYGHGGSNLAMALGAHHVQAVGTPREDIMHVKRASILAGSVLFTRHLVDLTRAVVCQPSWIDWTEGVQWVRTAHGPLILKGASGPSNGTIRISYTSVGSGEEISSSGRIGEMSLVYAGTNRHDDAPTRLECYRAVLASVDSMPLISESSGVISLTFNVLPVRSGRSDIHWYRRVSGTHMAGAYV